MNNKMLRLVTDYHFGNPHGGNPHSKGIQSAKSFIFSLTATPPEKQRGQMWTKYHKPETQKGSRAFTRNPLNLLLVPEVGIEPTWGCPRWILSPVQYLYIYMLLF